MDEQIGQPNTLAEPSPLRIALVVAWAVIVAVFGGYLCGLAIAEFGTLGATSLWALGAVAGFAGRKILDSKSKPAGMALVVACIFAFFVAEVCWIHWRIIPAQESWLAAVKWIPNFLRRYTIAALLGALFCAFGASSAFRQVAVRYRIVRIVEE